MFPDYFSAQSSVASSTPQLAEYICLEVGWALAAVLCLTGTLASAGVGLGVGLALTEAGFLTADTSESFLHTNGASPGHWLAIAGLLAGGAGLLAVASALPWSPPGHRRGPLSATVFGLALAVLAVSAYFPNWDSGVVATSTGNAFSRWQPAGVTTGALVSAAALAGVVAYAALWRATTAAAAATVGATIALASQLVSSYLQVKEGVPRAEMVTGRHLALSGYWWADVAAGVGLAVWAGWLLFLEQADLAPAAGGGPAEPPGTAGEARETNGPDDWPAHHHWPRHHAHQEM